MIIKKHIRPKANICLTIFFLIPLLYCSFLIHQYSVDVPFLDDWDVVKHEVWFENNGFSISKLWEMSVSGGGHRVFFSELIFLLVSVISKWDMRAVMWVSLFLMTCTCVLLIVYQYNRGKDLTVCLPVSVIIFFLQQTGVFYWAYEISFVLCRLAAIACLLFWEKYRIQKKKRLFAVCILSGIVSTYSSGQGMLVWIALLFCMALKWIVEKQKPKKYEIITLLFACLCFIGYFLGLKNTSFLNNGNIAANLFNIFVFAVSLAGASIARNITAAVAVGSIFLLMTGIVIYLNIRKKTYIQTLPFMMLIYSWGVICVTAISRYSWGMEKSLETTYTTFSLLIPLSIILTVNQMCANVTVKRILSAVLSVMLFWYSCSSINLIKHMNMGRILAQYVVYNNSEMPASLQKKPELVEYLEQNRYSLFQQEGKGETEKRDQQNRIEQNLHEGACKTVEGKDYYYLYINSIPDEMKGNNDYSASFLINGNEYPACRYENIVVGYVSKEALSDHPVSLIWRSVDDGTE
ncbi:MAG: hypothetical protein K6F61_08765 [Clostridiales bacterium]|nr:hypothetical protein [Clostridiales bacterium]